MPVLCHESSHWCFSFYLARLTQTFSCTPSYPPKALHLLPTSLSFLGKQGYAKRKKKSAWGKRLEQYKNLPFLCLGENMKSTKKRAM